MSTPWSLPSPSSLLCMTHTLHLPKTSCRLIIQWAAYPLGFVHPVLSVWVPTGPRASHQASGISSSEKHFRKLPGGGRHTLPSQPLCCHLPAFSLPKVSPQVEQGPVRSVFVSWSPERTGHEVTCEWAMVTGSTFCARLRPSPVCLFPSTPLKWVQLESPFYRGEN